MVKKGIALKSDAHGPVFGEHRVLSQAMAECDGQ